MHTEKNPTPDSPGQNSERLLATGSSDSTLIFADRRKAPAGSRESAIRWGQMTRCLQSWDAGNPTALEKLTPMVRDELRALVADSVAKGSNRPLQPTSLVNNVLGRLGMAQRSGDPSRAALMATVMDCMRTLLVEVSRENRRGRLVILPIEVVDQDKKSGPIRVDSTLLSRLLVSLKELDPRLSRVVELRIFAGISTEETAGLLGISRLAARRDWIYARAWLREELGQMRKGWSRPIH